MNHYRSLGLDRLSTRDWASQKPSELCAGQLLEGVSVWAGGYRGSSKVRHAKMRLGSLDTLHVRVRWLWNQVSHYRSLDLDRLLGLRRRPQWIGLESTRYSIRKSEVVMDNHCRSLGLGRLSV